MRFAVQEKKPYLISGGKAYPVELTENHGVKISIEEGRKTELTGYLTYEEVAAKFGKIETEVVPQETELLGVHVYDLISPGTKITGDGSVIGTLYKAKVEEFSTVKAEQQGYFFPAKLTKTGETVTIVKDGKTRTVPYPDDNMALIKIPGKDTNVKIEVDGEELVTLNFRRTVFSGKTAYEGTVGRGEAFIPDKDQTPLGDITVSQMISDDTKAARDGTVTGTINYLTDMPEYDSGQKDGHFFPLQFSEKNFKELHVGGEVSDSGFTAGKDFTPSVDDPFLVIRVENLTDKKVSIFDKTSREKLFGLDFKGATLQDNPAALSARRSKKVAKPLTE